MRNNGGGDLIGDTPARGINSPNPQLRGGPLVWFWLAELPALTISERVPFLQVNSHLFVLLFVLSYLNSFLQENKN